ncbi:protein translocase subunit SecD [Nocardioides baekrokdamisoli]|uniref:Protein translocase subunit SecD n=1 Tax=Nocardioides baekrokdamisoli TaxID=1804624 RepID=A0A3G9IBS2_9ACTN|nr:protein translocase subunit SecD [Nocardioides baekrokdamisoli]BBH16330.1 protein translocase subunit SecD [Nocardioides baekrokdamisoli]
MASQTMRPSRTLFIFGAILALAYVLIGVNNAWKPQLGLDLQGGQMVRLKASTQQGGQTLTSDSFALARDIIDQRANGSGVSGAKVTTDGGSGIDVAIPGKGQASENIVKAISAPSQLRFRLVVCSTGSDTICQGLARSAVGPLAKRAPFASPSTTAKPTPSASIKPTASTTPTATAAPSATPSDVMSLADAKKYFTGAGLDEQAAATAYESYICGTPVNDVPGKPLVTCDQPDPNAKDANGNPIPAAQQGLRKYLLTPAIIEGTELSSASYGQSANSASYEVDLSLKDAGSKVFADTTAYIAGTGGQFAITVDGQVVSAPTASQRIGGGNAQITGNFTLDQAKSLSNNLKFGQLPVKFDVQEVQVIGPELAGSQLSAGLWAGAIGLLLVMIFSLVYYRGLGLVVIGSLMFAGAATYSLVALLSKGAGVTLDLPGIAGLIVAVGITADSFIVYFERIRDEMRDGKSMRVAVDAAWVRARRTCLAADSVSLLAALTLYFFASNDVKGFAFMLGLSTVIDLVVFFYFTHPLVKLLSLRRFFNRGHRLSGLDARTLGVDAITVGGKA